VPQAVLAIVAFFKLTLFFFSFFVSRLVLGCGGGSFEIK
jgi:hypothetical protein